MYDTVIAMTEAELDTAMDELDRLINDPDTRLDPERVWVLLAEVSSRSATTRRTSPETISSAA